MKEMRFWAQRSSWDLYESFIPDESSSPRTIHRSSFSASLPDQLGVSDRAVTGLLKTLKWPQALVNHSEKLDQAPVIFSKFT
ncbi:hypothetical protein DV515_00012250 [Chloebia gouldiae]|uniref:Uncharacterized protein n=1 Tax=Chloebia gouldiae TaxID=44316 RepID=A0A3L8S4P4_CHLGU|nr:hypothetical protein DV515_00012250 [Chloebia gouldiae]